MTTTVSDITTEIKTEVEEVSPIDNQFTAIILLDFLVGFFI